MGSKNMFLIIGLILIVIYFILDKLLELPEYVAWLLLIPAVICLLIGISRGGST